MNGQEPWIEDRATWGDVVGAIVAAVICLGVVALAVNFNDMKDRPSAVTTLDAPSLLFIP